VQDVKKPRKPETEPEPEERARALADFEDACRGIERGHADFEAGRSRPAQDVLNDLRRKYDLPG
jgi:predicted transcriptional regulator